MFRLLSTTALALILATLVLFWLLRQNNAEGPARLETAPRPDSEAQPASISQAPDPLEIKVPERVGIQEGEHSENLQPRPQLREAAAGHPTKQDLVRHFEDLLEIALTVGIDPSVMAEELLGHLESTKPDPESVKALLQGGGVSYSLSGLPEGLQGEMILWDGEEKPFHRDWDLYLNVPFEEPRLVGGVPRHTASFSLSTSIGEDRKPSGCSVMARGLISGDASWKMGIDPNDQNHVFAVAYSLAADGQVFSSRLHPPPRGDGEQDLGLVLGPLRLSDPLVERIQKILLNAARTVKPKEFSKEVK